MEHAGSTKTAGSGPRRTLILARPEGQLGNRLFLGATVLAFAAENELRLLNPALGGYSHLFLGTRKGWCAVFPPPPDPARFLPPPGLRRLLARGVDAFAGFMARQDFSVPRMRVLDVCESHDRADLDYDLEAPEFRHLLRGSGWLVLRGWKFRAHAALQRQHPLIHEIFRPVPDIESAVSASLLRARTGIDRLIGIHVRQGDYRHWLGGKYFFSHENYLSWMVQAAALWPEEKIGFLVCSNGDWTVDRIAGCPVARGPGGAVEDLYALAGCDAIMGPPSSFSLWASYYGKIPLHMLESADQQVHPVTFTHHQRI